MREKIITAAVFAALLGPCFAAGQSTPDPVIWKEFVRLLKTGTLTVDRIHPDDVRTRESRLENLRQWTKDADWTEWEAAPKIVRYGNLVSFIVRLGESRKSPWDYIFCFVVEDGRWSYRFLEGIFIRLDQSGPLPADAAEFPDLPEERKHWMRQEIYWSKMVWLYQEMKKMKGKEYALSLFKDGAGYALSATVWVPFFPSHRAFILYLCWEQAKLQGNTTVLEKLDDREAVVRFEDHQYFALYQQASHLKDQIGLDEYIGIFETLWQDRAKAAGWTLQIDGQGRKIFLRFSR